MGCTRIPFLLYYTHTRIAALLFSPARLRFYFLSFHAIFSSFCFLFEPSYAVLRYPITPKLCLACLPGSMHTQSHISDASFGPISSTIHF